MLSQGATGSLAFILSICMVRRNPRPMVLSWRIVLSTLKLTTHSGLNAESTFCFSSTARLARRSSASVSCCPSSLRRAFTFSNFSSIARPRVATISARDSWVAACWVRMWSVVFRTCLVSCSAFSNAASRSSTLLDNAATWSTTFCIESSVPFKTLRECFSYSLDQICSSAALVISPPCRIRIVLTSASSPICPGVSSTTFLTAAVSPRTTARCSSVPLRILSAAASIALVVTSPKCRIPSALWASAIFTAWSLSRIAVVLSSTF
mmetsp:Transcript_24477/g.52223  ORF Transcript_24477/g.52223 Transcript_24477/m.52223 type:complete len:265 (-) Transcript_24477:451-1245(-)